MFNSSTLMPIFKSSIFLLSVTMFITGCAIDSRPYSPPIDKALQDPMPGQAIVYLLRAPYDDAGLEVSISGKTVAVLPPGTYTAVSLPPGRHTLRTRATGLFGGDSNAAQSLEIELQPDTRRFLNVSGTMVETVNFAGVIPLARGGVLPLLMQGNGTARGSRTWKEVRELDAQGLMSIGRLVLPE